MRFSLIVVVVILVLTFIGVNQLLFTVDTTEQAIVTQFGQFKRSELSPGLKFKSPFIEQVTRFSKRLLRYDLSPTSLLTSDKKNLIIDAYARYRIVDPLKTFQTVGDELGADARIGSIISSELRKNVASHSQQDIIASTRAELMANITELAAIEANTFGIEIIDVRIKRADFPDEVAQSVFSRMNAERNREATQFRAEGSEEELKIKAEADKQRAIILAEAGKQSQIIRGEGEAEAISIFAEAYGRDPEFYYFTRTLEAYGRALASDTTVVLSADSDLFRYLEDPAGEE
jgi:membrane protease subunit HflC